MGRIGLALVAFFRILFDGAFAEAVRRVREGEQLPRSRPAEPQLAQPARPAQAAAQALSLLAAFQREARLVDFLKEDLGAYSDAQVGAAVRDVHRDCAALMERLFAIRPVEDQPEGSGVELPGGFDAGRIRLTGKVAGAGPFRGVLRHGGWVATKVDLPEWTGDPEAARVVAPAEVEVEEAGSQESEAGSQGGRITPPES